MRLSNGNSIKTDGNHQSSIYNGSQHCWMGGTREIDLILLFFFFRDCLYLCVCLRALYIKNLIPPLIFFCSCAVCLLGRRLLFVCLSSQSHSQQRCVLLYANVSRAWWGVILFALHLGYSIDYILDRRHVSIKDTQVPPPPLSSTGFHLFLFRFDLGPSPAQVKSVSLIFSTDPN